MANAGSLLTALIASEVWVRSKGSIPILSLTRQFELFTKLRVVPNQSCFGDAQTSLLGSKLRDAASALVALKRLVRDLLEHRFERFCFRSSKRERTRVRDVFTSDAF
jgi:hypothetical protein